MELRVLRYFAAVVRTGSISAAARELHITQPTLSRQLASLEAEFEVELLERNGKNRQIRLTPAGLVMHERTLQLLAEADRLRFALMDFEAKVTGDVSIGGGETQGMRFLAAAAARLHRVHPGIRLHVHSGNAAFLEQGMLDGTIDIGVLVGEAGTDLYEVLPLPVSDTWGIVMRSDDPLSQQSSMTPDMVLSMPLIMSEQMLAKNELSGWLGQPASACDVVATYNLLQNAVLLVDAGMGRALAIDHLAGSRFCFRPLSPPLRARLSVVWLRARELSRPAQLFLESLRVEIAAQDSSSVKHLGSGTRP